MHTPAATQSDRSFADAVALMAMRQRGRRNQAMAGWMASPAFVGRR